MTAPVCVASNLRAVLAAHVALQFMNRRALSAQNDVERDGLMCVAAKAFHLESAMAAPTPES
jgi:hypothetical protein